MGACALNDKCHYHWPFCVLIPESGTPLQMPPADAEGRGTTMCTRLRFRAGIRAKGACPKGRWVPSTLRDNHANPRGWLYRTNRASGLISGV